MTDKQLTPGREFWNQASTVKLSWWPDAFIVVLVLVFHSIAMKLCETYLGNEHVAGGITGLLAVYLGPKWLDNIQRRNLQNAPDSEEADADSTDVQDDVPEE